MGRILKRASEGASLGAVLGGALGTLLAGATLALPGLNIVIAPFMIAAAATTVTVSGTAAGTLVGGAGGAIAGAVEERKHSSKGCDRERNDDTGAML